MRTRLGLAALLAALAALGLVASAASAASQRAFLETLGPVQQPTFQFSERAESVGVDRASGQVLVGLNDSPVKFKRYNADGTPASFAALGANELDGKLGPGGKPCAEEPASCDKTPQNGLSINAPNFASNQIAFDPTNGNILITQIEQNVVDIFSPEGRYLGQLTQAGTALTQPCGVAVNPNGIVYVAQNNRISRYTPSGNPPANADFKGNFTLTGVPNACRIALGTGASMGFLFIASTGSESNEKVLKVDAATGAFTTYVTGYQRLAAVDPNSGNPLLYKRSTDAALNGFAELSEFDGSLETAITPLARLLVERPNLQEINDFAIDSAGRVDAVYTASSDPTNILVYGEPIVVPTVSVDLAADITSSGATLMGSVLPEDVAIAECFFQYGPTFLNGAANWERSVPCEGAAIPPDSEEHPVQATISELKPNGVKYNFRLVVRYASGAEYSAVRFFNTGSSAETLPPTIEGLGSATLNGILRPEGSQYTECFFKWGIANNPGFEHTAPCTPAAAAIPPDNGSHPVTAALSGLEEATTYRVQLFAKNSVGTQEGPILSFETSGPPLITAVRASDASQSTVRLEAEIDPRGFPATYRFEWGPTAAYGNVAPATFASVPPGSPPILVSADLAGLAPGGSYHYRIVVSGGAGTTPSADHELQTLNSCGLPDGRCLELVSPRDPGFVALPGERKAQSEPGFQASEASGSLAYEVELGFDGATTGGEILYMGSRGSNGWSAAQYSPSLTGAGPNSGIRASTLGLSSDLSCGIVASKLLLTSDPVARVNVDAGGSNLYRRGPDGTYTLITNVAPEEPKRIGELRDEFSLIGLSPDCRRVVFETALHYGGVGAGKRLYEWQEGQLRYVGWVPSGSGEVMTEAGPGSGNISSSAYNAVSRNASRVFFTATSKVGNDLGNKALFVRIDGTKTLNVSQSPLAVNTGAVFQGATPDGSRVYFTANAGLTPETSAGGLDLYECHIITGSGGQPECELTDLSVNHEPGGVAEVGGRTSGGIGALVGLADDGSGVYFIASGQLLPGQGVTLAQNQAAETFSLYRYEAASETVRFVASVGAAEVEKNVTTGYSSGYSSRTSPDGRYLVFESRANNTGYESGGKPMVYLYDAEAPTKAEALTCVSCRQDGQPSVYPSTLTGQLSRPGSNRTHLPQSLVIRGGRPLVFFKSGDALAPGAVEREWNLYEWNHDQVFKVASDLPGATPPAGEGTLEFFGASADGTDLYFVDAAALNWENPEGRRAVWDARVGGGFPQPTPVADCNPASEGSCQGQNAPAPPSAPIPGSATFNGPGNVKPKQPKKKKQKHKKKQGKHKKQKQRKGKKGQNKNKKGGRQ